MAQHTAELRNSAHQLQKPDKKLWHALDFLQTKEGYEYRARRQREREELARETMREKSQAAAMKAGNFDESQLPVWARMTDEEKKARRRPN